MAEHHGGSHSPVRDGSLQRDIAGKDEAGSPHFDQVDKQSISPSPTHDAGRGPHRPSSSATGHCPSPKEQEVTDGNRTPESHGSGSPVKDP